MRLNCIIVDDDPVFRHVLKVQVEKERERLNLVCVADSAEAAIEKCNREAIDLIFLDVGLPGMDGFEFIEAMDHPEAVQIILVTGDKNHALDAFEYGITDYLVKPISQQRLQKAIRKAMRNHGATAGQQRPENKLLARLSRYMQSRDMQTLQPVPLRSAKLGYAYPLLSAHYEFGEEENMLKLLEQAEQSGYLRGEFIDTMYVCNTCYNSQLHFRETCPSCHSSNLENEDLVHHFSCAYVGPVSDFYQKSTDSNMVCPKCEKTLNHIGVDYEKPSLIYHCRRCDEQFQNAEIRAKCHNCGADSRVEHLVKQSIKKYQLTKAGKMAGKQENTVNVQLNAPRPEDEDSSLERALKDAVRKKREQGSESCLGQMRIANIADLYDRISAEESNILQNEIEQLLRQAVDINDTVTFINPITARFLFEEKTSGEAKAILKAAAADVHEAIVSNYDDVEVEIQMQVRPVEAGTPARRQLELLTRESGEDDE